MQIARTREKKAEEKNTEEYITLAECVLVSSGADYITQHCGSVENLNFDK